MLYGASALGDGHVWAVGTFEDALGYNQTLIESWNGVAWTVVSSPNQGSSHNVLNGVATAASDDAWAVGYYMSDLAAHQTLIEHWDGTAWNVVPSPNASLHNNDLQAVAVATSTDIWAVGSYTNDQYRLRALIEHWDGSDWSIVPGPTRDNDVFFGVGASSATEAWAVGVWVDQKLQNRTLTVHWDGATWTPVHSANRGRRTNHLSAVAISSAADAWAVGYALSERLKVYRTLIEHWDGASWTVTPSLNRGSSTNWLFAITGRSPNDMWTVGMHADSNEVDRTLALHWDGTDWQLGKSPDSGRSNNLLFGVAASPTTIWGVGESFDPEASAYRTLAGALC